jgi:hypothetical protein
MFQLPGSVLDNIPSTGNIRPTNKMIIDRTVNISEARGINATVNVLNILRQCTTAQRVMSYSHQITPMKFLF